MARIETSVQQGSGTIAAAALASHDLEGGGNMKQQVRTASIAATLAFATSTIAATALVAVPTVAQAQVPVTAELLVGRWTDNGNCSSDAVDFTADGRFVTTTGARGTWSLVGNRLTFHGQTSVSATVTAQSRDRITLTHADGSAGSSTRCAPSTAHRFVMPPVPQTAAAALSAGRRIDRAYLLGRWTDTGDCSVVIDFLADGRFITPGGTGRWTFDGDRLSFIGNTTIVARARGVGENRILLIHNDGSVGQSVRCR